jgi:phosphopantothenoylcysteine synthetase/decarboxylase
MKGMALAIRRMIKKHHENKKKMVQQWNLLDPVRYNTIKSTGKTRFELAAFSMTN